jgi:hypothetical protein
MPILITWNDAVKLANRCHSEVFGQHLFSEMMTMMDHNLPRISAHTMERIKERLAFELALARNQHEYIILGGVHRSATPGGRRPTEPLPVAPPVVVPARDINVVQRGLPQTGLLPYPMDVDLERPAGNFAAPVVPERTYNSVRSGGRDAGPHQDWQALFALQANEGQHAVFRPRQDSYGMPGAARQRTATPPPRVPVMIPPPTQAVQHRPKRPAPPTPLIPQFVPRPAGPVPPRPICDAHGLRGEPETCAYCNSILVWWYRYGQYA